MQEPLSNLFSETDLSGIDEKYLISRVSRELDRFFVVLAQIEAASEELLSHAPPATRRKTDRALQNIDYLSQVSSALSLVLDDLANQRHMDLQTRLNSLVPTDLKNRLLDQDLEDIDNADQKSCFF